MKVAIACDHGGLYLKSILNRGVVTSCGTNYNKGEVKYGNTTL